MYTHDTLAGGCVVQTAVWVAWGGMGVPS